MTSVCCIPLLSTTRHGSSHHVTSGNFVSKLIKPCSKIVWFILFLVVGVCRLLINSSMILQLWSRYFNVKYKVLIRVSVDSVDTARRQVPLPTLPLIFNNGGVSLFSKKSFGLMCTI